MSFGSIVKVLGALWSWLGLKRTLELVSFGRSLLEKIKNAERHIRRD